MACHQADGKGLPGAFPPLAGSDYLLGDKDRAVGVVVRGLEGEVVVNGVKYNSVMPAMTQLSDQEIADALTYAMNSWGNQGGAVAVAQVAAVRAKAAAEPKKASSPTQHPTTTAELKYQGAPSPAGADGVKILVTPGAPDMTEPEFKHAQQIYFQRCAGCHGVLRKGATGKPLTPDITQKKGTEYLKVFINQGSPAGMPSWGKSGELTPEEVDIMARFVQHEPPQPPEFGMKEIKASWNVIVPVSERPTRQQNKYNLDNIFAVTLRDAGEVALIDGDTKEIINVIRTGYAVHISRLSHSGRYVYTIGRDGKIDLIDLYIEKPDQGGRDQGRPRGALGRDLEVQGLRGQVRDRRRLLAAAVHDHGRPDPRAAQGRLDPRHDGGHAGVPPRAARGRHRRLARASGVHRQRQGNRPDPAGQLRGHQQPQDHDDRRRALPARRRLGRHQALLPDGRQPVEQDRGGRLEGAEAHGAGGRRQDPAPGPRRELRRSEVRSGVGDERARQREGHADRHRPREAQGQRLEGGARAEGPGRRLAVRQDAPEVDATSTSTRTLNPDPKISQSVAVFDINNLEAGYKVLPIAEWANLGEGPKRVVQPEYNAAGDEVWFSVWNGKDQRSAIVVVDDKTLKLKKVIDDARIVTPTGKFNVHNTVGDVY